MSGYDKRAEGFEVARKYQRNLGVRCHFLEWFHSKQGAEWYCREVLSRYDDGQELCPVRCESGIWVVIEIDHKRAVKNG